MVLSPSKKKNWQFPFKLCTMLEDTDCTIASWNPGGLSFTIHQPDLFVTDIAHKYFRQTKFRSFVTRQQTRQLNMWGFENLHDGKWKHSHFMRGDVVGLHVIKRLGPPGERRKEHNKDCRGKIGNQEIAHHDAARYECIIGTEISIPSKRTPVCHTLEEIGSAHTIRSNKESDDDDDFSLLLSRVGEAINNDVHRNQESEDDDTLLIMSKSIVADDHKNSCCSLCLPK
ncbi:hypothetical protein ACHAWF_007739 [Thalassiosira exigua]